MRPAASGGATDPVTKAAFGDTVALHQSDYPRAVDAQGNADCESGQRGYPNEGVFTDHRTPGNQGPTYKGIAHVPDGRVLLRRAGRHRAVGAAMRRERGPTPFVVGVTLLVLAVIATYLSFAKDVPFINEPYEIKAAFRDTAGITPHSPVRIAGVEVGEVTHVEHTRPGAQSATVTLAIRDKGLPVHEDASAKIRPRIFLEGNFFVDLSPGSAGSGEMGEGETIPASRTTTPVQFDQVLGALKSDTRNDLRDVFSAVSTARDAGGARAFNDSLRFQPAAYKFTAIVSEALLGKRPGDLGDWIRDQGVVSGAADADPAKLRSLVVDFNRTAGALADRESALTAAVGELPRTLRAATPALDALEAAFPDVRALRAGRAAGRALARADGRRAAAARQAAARRGPGERARRAVAQPAQRDAAAGDRRQDGGAGAVEAAPAVELRERGARAVRQRPDRRQGVPDPRPRLPGAREVHERARRREPLVRRQRAVVQGPGVGRRGDAEPRQRALRLGDRADRRDQPRARQDAPAARTRRAVRDAGAAGPALDPGAARRPRSTRAASRSPREAKATATAVAIERRQLKSAGSKTKVSDHLATLADLRKIADLKGVTAQLEQSLRESERRP